MIDSSIFRSETASVEKRMQHSTQNYLGCLTFPKKTWIELILTLLFLSHHTILGMTIGDTDLPFINWEQMFDHVDVTKLETRQ